VKQQALNKVYMQGNNQFMKLTFAEERHTLFNKKQSRHQTHEQTDVSANLMELAVEVYCR